MDNLTLIRGLQKLVSLHGSAKVAVMLNYRDSRAIGVWLATKKIPKARRELVQSIINKQGGGNERVIRSKQRENKKTV